MMKDKKLNREELKDFFRKKAIKEIVNWGLNHYAGNEVAISNCNRQYFSSIWFGNAWTGAGWSRSTMTARWNEFIAEGFISEGYKPLVGYIDTQEWRQGVIDKSIEYFLSHGLSFEPQHKSLFDIDCIREDCYRFLLKEFDLC